MHAGDKENDKAYEAAVDELVGDPESRADEFAANLHGELENIENKPVSKLDDPIVVEGTVDPTQFDAAVRERAMEKEGATAEDLSEVAKEVAQGDKE